MGTTDAGMAAAVRACIPVSTTARIGVAAGAHAVWVAAAAQMLTVVTRACMLAAA